METHEKMKVEVQKMKKLMMLIAGGILSAPLPLAAATEMVGGYTWTFQINSDTAEIYNDDWATREVDDTNGKTNLSSLKLTFAAKTGIFKGSFKAYALEEKNGKTKLVKYTVNVLGLVVDGVGQGEATCKKPAGGPWPVTVE